MKRSTLFQTVLAFGVAIPLVAWAGQGTTSTGAASTDEAHHATHHKHASKPKVDLNTAGKEDLMALPGMDETKVDKIIAGRPFKAKDELEKRHLVTKEEYKQLSALVMVKQTKPETAKK